MSRWRAATIGEPDGRQEVVTLQRIRTRTLALPRALGTILTVKCDRWKENDWRVRFDVQVRL